jgi:hypothetical protein
MKAQVESDGKTVWVNSETGMCVGRFSWAGIDIHHDYEAQIQFGRQCMHCKKGPTNAEDWDAFKAEMATHYGVRIDNRHAPRFLS